MDKERLIKYLKEGNSYRRIAELTGFSCSTVKYYINKYNLKEYSKNQKRIYRDEYYFNKIDTKEKAYMIGYFLADAYIAEKSVELGCALIDKEILEFICKELTVNGKVNEDLILEKETRRFPRARFTLSNKNIRTDLLKHCSSKEDKRVPIIPKYLERYMVQGFFDGDGCLTWGRRKDRDRIWQKVSFSSSLSLVTSIQKILIKNGISSTIRPKKNENCFVLEFSSRRDVINFLEYIYPDNQFIILHRKYEKANALRLELGEFGGPTNTEPSL